MWYERLWADPRFKKFAPYICLLLLAGGVAVAVDDADDNGTPDRITIVIGKANSTEQAKPDPVVVDAEGDAKTAIGDPTQPVAKPVTADTDQSSDNEPADAAENPGLHEDLVDETPDDVDPNAVEQGLQQTEAPGLGAPRPVGGAKNYECRYKPVVNQSSRGGVKALIAPLHYTVSRNRPGWSDVYAIWGLFNTRSFSASSTYIMDWEGHCLRLMSEGAKPWTQGNFNGRSVSIEIIAYGDESRQAWLDAPIFKKGILASLWRDVLRRNGLPLAYVNPVGCTVQKAGWTDHNALECGNDHHDVEPNFPKDVFQKQLVAGSAPACSTRCRRARSLRTRNSAAHHSLKVRNCAPRSRTRSTACKKLHATHDAIHRAAKREGVKL